jgi:ribosomal protein S18 acetylase RimI-like enzyme
MRANGLTRSATDTARDNHQLIALYRKHGYEVVLEAGEMVRLARHL